ncbi:MAG: cellulase family glycosylhydrolase [Spirochaetes bacterium]|nr:cellulase family glycosylhydrolase [Spirochaetota bacterium]
MKSQTFIQLIKIGFLGLVLAGLLLAQSNPIPVASLRGVNFSCAALLDREQGDRKGIDDEPADWLPRSFRLMAESGINTARVGYYWESYEKNPARFLAALREIAALSAKHQVRVIFTFFQWETTSFWDFKPRGGGFPSRLMKAYPNKGTRDETQSPFYEDLWNNAITQDGKTVWQLILDLQLKVVEQVDGMATVFGYEILNEPHILDYAQFEKLGAFHTFLAAGLRARTGKTLFFDMSYPTGPLKSGRDRTPENEIKIVPKGIGNLIYAPHLYAAPVGNNWGSQQLSLFKAVAAGWGLPLLMGEFGVGLTEKRRMSEYPFQNDVDAFLDGFRGAGFLGGVYWCWGLNPYMPEGLRVINGSYEFSPVFQYLLKRWASR